MKPETRMTRLYLDKHSGGTRWWYRLLANLFKTTRFEGGTSGEDTHCFIDCQCGEHFSANSERIFWCPKCNRGYGTRLEVYCYPSWLYKLRKAAYVPASASMLAYQRQAFKDNPRYHQDPDDHPEDNW